MGVRLEHANPGVCDIEAMTRFLQIAFPEFRKRGEGTSRDGTRWVHIGTNDTYIALGQSNAHSGRHWAPYNGEPGVNHLAFEVDDVESLHMRLKAAGYRDSTVPNAHPHRKRVYFHDPEGNDWEFVQYFSQDANERNDYEFPDS